MRIAAKVVLARLPLGYRFWKALGLFEHGAMKDADYVCSVFERHFAKTQLVRGWTGLELGPGDSVASALVARAKGAARIYLVDTGDFATRDLRVYRAVTEHLQSRGLVLDVPLDDFDSMLRACGTTYTTTGLSDLRTIPSGSVDFIWSQAVLEHIRQHEFLQTMQEMRRVLRADGIATHQVDLRDHLGGALNNLRFTDHEWEGPLLSRSGFYTNRIRFGEMLDFFTVAGFTPSVLTRSEWHSLPTPRARMAPRFRTIPETDLLVCSFFVLLRPV